MKYTSFITGLTLLLATPLHALIPMESIDLNRYVGTWYEIALIPNRFEKKCCDGAIATYTLLNNGEIAVTNSCCTSKGQAIARGIAWVANPHCCAKLKVSFVPVVKTLHWFGADYWILYVDPDYRTAIVGEPSYRYLWILSRDPHMEEETFNQLISIAKEKGYDSTRIYRVR